MNFRGFVNKRPARLCVWITSEGKFLVGLASIELGGTPLKNKGARCAQFMRCCLFAFCTVAYMKKANIYKKRTWMLHFALNRDNIGKDRRGLLEDHL